MSPLADLIGHREPVILGAGVIVTLFGLSSVVNNRTLAAAEASARAPQTPTGAPVDPMTIAMVPTDFTAAPPATPEPGPRKARTGTDDEGVTSQ